MRSAILLWAKSHGYEEAPLGSANLAFRDPNGIPFIIEAAGLRASPETDFNAGLGQLLRHMIDVNWAYALALPDVAQFKRQTAFIPDRVRAALGLYWLFVRQDGSVERVPPPRRRA